MSGEQTIIARVPKNRIEEVVISIDEFKGRKYLDVRVWSIANSVDDPRPTGKGLKLAPDRIEELIEGLNKARDAARLLGLETRTHG